jgi:hypothetical protein
MQYALVNGVRSQGKLSKVRNPSKAQVENQFPPIKWTKTERRLK